MTILDKLQESDVRRAYLSGIADGRLYFTVFRNEKGKFVPMVLFHDGEHRDVQWNAEDKVHYFETQGKRYIYDHKLWFQNNLSIFTIDNVGIRDFLSRKYPSKEELFSELLKLTDTFYDFGSSEEDRLICVLHIIHTYLISVLGRTIYLLLDGEKDTGKSTLQKIMARLQYNGCFVSKVSTPALVRKIHGFQISMNIDEFDKLGKDDKQLMLGVLNSGFYRGGTYEIVNTKATREENQLSIFKTFGAKTFSTNEYAWFDPTFLSRCITVYTIRGTRRTADIDLLNEETERLFQQMRNQLTIFCLLNGLQMIGTIEKHKNELAEIGELGRSADIISIMSGLQEFFAGERTLKDHLLTRKQFETGKGEADELWYYILEYLNSHTANDEGRISFSNKEIVEYIIQKLEINTENYDGKREKHSIASKVGHRLKSRKVVSINDKRKRAAGQGNWIYEIPKEKIQQIIRRDGIKELLIEEPDTSEKGSQGSRNIEIDSISF